MAKKGIFKLPIVLPVEKAMEIYQLLAKVNMVIGSMKSEFRHAIVNDSIVSMFSLNESVQSTRIEGTQVTFNDMIENTETKNPSWEQIEVMNYQEALHQGVDLIKNGYPISTRLIKELHKTLMKNARGTNSAGGEFRKIQNFIGPDNKIEHAVYIPVSAGDIDDYMENLEFFINGKAHSSFRRFNKTDGIVFDENSDPIIKSAILHAQFESIHPFLDGNGRLGRILIALFAVKENLVEYPVFLVSEELEKERARYYDLLNGIRGNNPDWFAWIKFFILACERMANSLLKKLNESEDLARNGLDICNLESEKKIWLCTFSEPITTATRISKKLNISPSTARKGLNKLVELGLLYSSEEIKRNKKYHNYDLLRILNK